MTTKQFPFLLSQSDANLLLGALVIAERSSKLRGNDLFSLDCAKIAERLRIASTKAITEEV